MNGEILTNDSLRLRIIDLEYENLRGPEFIAELKRMYFEENGKELPTDVKFLSSSHSLKDEQSSYNGTALHFYSKENKIDQLYIISQGSHGFGDWEYNLKAMVAGIEVSQAIATNKFIKAAKKEFGIKSKDTMIIGLSHSLAHNNNTTAHLLSKEFDKMYSVNGAQTNFYQLYRGNSKFRDDVEVHFKLDLKNSNSIYDVNPVELQKFTESYFDKQGYTQHIYQLISTDDPLFGVSGVNGFFVIGNVTYIDTNNKTLGIRSIMDQLPKEEVDHIRNFAINYTIASEKGRTEGIRELTGIDLSIFAGAKSKMDFAKLYLTKGNQINLMIEELNEKLPGLVTSIKKITRNSAAILGAFEEAGYITEAQKNNVIQELKIIEMQLDEICVVIELNHSIRKNQYEFSHLSSSFMSILGADIGSFIRLNNIFSSFQKSVDKLKFELSPMMGEIGASHTIAEMLNALTLGTNRLYSGKDMIMTKGNQIKVNISAAVRLYQHGQMLLDEKTTDVSNLMRTLDVELLDGFFRERIKVLHRISEIESNPVSFMDYSQACASPYGSTSHPIYANVHENLFPLRNVQVDEVYSIFQVEITKAREFLTNSRTAIESLFIEDEFVARLFDYSPKEVKPITFRFCAAD